MELRFISHPAFTCSPVTSKRPSQPTLLQMLSIYALPRHQRQAVCMYNTRQVHLWSWVFWSIKDNHKTSVRITGLRAGFQTRHFPNRTNPCGRDVKAYVCVLWFPGIAGSIPVWDMDICLFWVRCFLKHSSLRRADLSSRGVLPSLCVSFECDQVQQ